MFPCGLFGQGDSFLQRGWEELGPPHRPDPDPLLVDLGGDGDRPHFGLNEREEPVEFGRGTGEILSGQGKEGYEPDLELVQPVEYLFELIGADAVSRQGVLESELPGIPPIPIQDEADMAGHGASQDLPDEAPLVESVKRGEKVEHAGLTPSVDRQMSGPVLFPHDRPSSAIPFAWPHSNRWLPWALRGLAYRRMGDFGAPCVSLQ